MTTESEPGQSPPSASASTPAAELKRVDHLKALRLENIRRAAAAGQYGSRTIGCVATARRDRP